MRKGKETESIQEEVKRNFVGSKEERNGGMREGWREGVIVGRRREGERGS